MAGVGGLMHGVVGEKRAVRFATTLAAAGTNSDRMLDIPR